MPSLEDFGLEHVAGHDFVASARPTVAAMRLADEMVEYVVDLVRATREDPSLRCGASPRAANMLATASRAAATLEGRDFVIPDDVKFLFRPIMRHRLLLSPSAEVEGRTVDQVLDTILEQVPAPR